jgi:Zn-dependent protease with chaperone function
MDNDAGFDDAPVRTPAAQHPRLWSVLALTTLALAAPVMIVLVLVFAVAPAVPWWLGIVVGALFAVGVVAYRLRAAYPATIAALGAVPSSAGDRPRFHNLVQGLSLAGAVGDPELYVIDDPARNAASIARGERTGIVATTGLLDALDRIALEGVVAECLVRIGNGDAEAATVGAALFGPLLDGPLRAAGHLALGRLLVADRELRADRDAVALTRYPPGLSSALAAIGAGTARVAQVPERLDHVWLVPPSALGGAGATTTTAAPLSLRIDVLGEL